VGAPATPSKRSEVDGELRTLLIWRDGYSRARRFDRPKARAARMNYKSNYAGKGTFRSGESAHGIQTLTGRERLKIRRQEARAYREALKNDPDLKWADISASLDADYR